MRNNYTTFSLCKGYQPPICDIGKFSFGGVKELGL